MSKKEWIVFFEEFHLLVRRRTQKGETVSFAVVLCAVVEGERISIARYDTAHGYAHRDVLGLNEGLRGKLPMLRMNHRAGFEYAIRDLTKTPKSTLPISSHTKRDGKMTGSRMTAAESDDILMKYGFRPATAEESRIVREAESRTKAKHSKRLLAD
jgi:hypothetical protein